MPPRIPETTRWTVIEKWMLGYPRNGIAVECEVSNGAVTTIVDEWRRSTGPQLATLIREIGMTLRKLGMTPAQCVIGLRIVKLAERIGLDENSLESYMSEVYTKCQNMGVSPNHIANYAYELVSLLEADGINGQQQEQEQEQQEQQEQQSQEVTMRKIDALFERRKQTKIELEEEVRSLMSRLRKLQQETADSQTALQGSLEATKKIESVHNWISNMRAQLEENRLDVSDLSKLVTAARFFSESGVSVHDLVREFLNYKQIKEAILDHERQLASLRQQCHDLEEILKLQENLLEENKLKNKELEELKKMGFGLWGLKTLRNLVAELAIENGQPVERGEAVKMFVSDIEKYYPDYLRLRGKVNQLKADEAALRDQQRQKALNQQ
jgi:myosin heavy subunit